MMMLYFVQVMKLVFYEMLQLIQDEQNFFVRFVKLKVSSNATRCLGIRLLITPYIRECNNANIFLKQ